MKEVIELTIKKYISEKAEEISSLIEEHHKVFIESNPATGKTTFFKEFAKGIVDNSLKRRIVFVFPLLLIQDQLKESLIKDEYKIDLELNFKSKRKYLNDNDRIITSTFQSLHYISTSLTKEDIIIVDEAHSLFKSYPNPEKKKRTFLSKPLIDLYLTKANIVLMSGTIPDGIIRLLNLKHIKLTNDPPPLKAKVVLLPARGSKKQIAIEFAKASVNKNGSDSLNIIYLKNIKEGVKIANYLNSINLNSKVLNSGEKRGSLYLSITKRMIVPEDIQILITTNIISSGANIMNTNIGDALMIDEYSPAEIKQFSKRFRNKLDIEVTLANSPIKGPEENLADTIDRKILLQRRYLTRILNVIKSTKGKSMYNYDYSYSYDTSPLATPDELIKQIIDRYLKQETFYWENYHRFVEDSFIYIADELNKYDDIEAVYFERPNLSSDIIEYNDGDLTSELNDIRIDFIKYPEKFISTAINNVDTYCRFQILRLLKQYNQGITYPEKLKYIQHPLFQKEILDPLLVNVEYFENDPRKCLYFLMKNSTQELTKYKISYTVSKFLNEHITFQPDIESPGDYIACWSSTIVKSLLDDESQNLFNLIKVIVQYCFNDNSVILTDLTEQLNKNLNIKNILNFSDGYNRLPLRELTLTQKGYKLDRIFLIAILRGIFYIGREQTKTINSNKKRVNAFPYLERLPEKDERIQNKDYLKLYHTALRKSEPIVTHTVINRPTKKFGFSFRQGEMTKIPSSPELLQLNYFDKEFYDLVED